MLGVGEARKIPRLKLPFDLAVDLNQHNRHLLPAITIGAGVTYLAGICGSSKRAMRMIGAGTTSFVGGVLFELGMFNDVYANNPSVADALWTTALAGIGSLCVAASQMSKTQVGIIDALPVWNAE